MSDHFKKTFQPIKDLFLASYVLQKPTGQFYRYKKQTKNEVPYVGYPTNQVSVCVYERSVVALPQIQIRLAIYSRIHFSGFVVFTLLVRTLTAHACQARSRCSRTHPASTSKFPAMEGTRHESIVLWTTAPPDGHFGKYSNKSKISSWPSFHRQTISVTRPI